MKNYSDNIIDPTNLDEKISEVKSFVIKACLLGAAVQIAIFVSAYFLFIAKHLVPTP